MAVLAGVAFGLAITTKYTAAPYYLAMAAFLAFSPAGRRYLFGPFLLTSAIAAIPFAQNLAWNYDHCAINFAFNFSFRSGHPGFAGVVNLIAFLLLGFGPLAVFLARSLWQQRRRLGFYPGFFITVLAVTLLIALMRGSFQPNWILTLLPLLPPVIAALSRPGRPELWLHWQQGYLLVVILPIALILGADRLGHDPLDNLLNPQTRADIARELDVGDLSLVEALRPYAKGRVLASWYYGASARFANNGYDETVVFSQYPYGRAQDLYVDFRALDGRDFIYVFTDPTHARSLAEKIFDSFEMIEVQGRRGGHQVLLGRGFRFAAFREEMIVPVLTQYYDRSPFPYRACEMDRYRIDSVKEGR